MTPSNPLVPWNQSEDAESTLARLVRAAQNDGPSVESLRAATPAIAALLAASATTTIAAATGSAGAAFGAKHSLGGLLLLKWFGVGVLAGGAVMAVGSVPRWIGPAPAVTVRTAPALANRSPEQPGLHATRRRAEPAASVAGLASPPRPSAKTDLAREIVLLDRARAALAAGTPERALEELDALALLPARVLAPEATVLRVRALLAAGRREQARAVVEGFARRSPGSPQVGVLRGLLNENGSKPPAEIDATEE